MEYRVLNVPKVSEIISIMLTLSRSMFRILYAVLVLSVQKCPTILKLNKIQVSFALCRVCFSLLNLK